MGMKEDFIALPPQEQHKVLMQMNSDYANLPDKERFNVIGMVNDGKIDVESALKAKTPNEKVSAPKTKPQIGSRALDVLGGAIEVPLSLASGAVGGVTGLASSIVSQPFIGDKRAKEFREFTSDFYTYKPRTESGRGAMEVLGTLLSPLTLPRKAGEALGGEQWGNLGEVATLGLLFKLPKTIKANKTMESQINSVIDAGIEKGIKPSVSGKSTASQYASYKTKSRAAVKDIVENKNSLVFEGEAGATISGELPQSLKQFSDAITQRKMETFKQYDAMARESGEQGARVNLKDVTKELEPTLNSVVLNDLHPEVVKYAKGRFDALSNRGAYTASEAQEAITTLNQSLDAFYKNPTYETASKAAIDSTIANNLRKGLDSAIEGLQGRGYQGLKNKYGSLKAIEKDVAHRMVVDARKNIKGIFDISDVFSGYHLVNGLITANPATIASGITAKGISAYYKKINNPNHIIKKMFTKTEKLMNDMGRQTSKRSGIATAGAYEATIGKDREEN